MAKVLTNVGLLSNAPVKKMNQFTLFMNQLTHFMNQLSLFMNLCPDCSGECRELCLNIIWRIHPDASSLLAEKSLSWLMRQRLIVVESQVQTYPLFEESSRNERMLSSTFCESLPVLCTELPATTGV